MLLEELLSSLGYDGSPCFLRRGDGRFESEMGYGHIFRRAMEPKNAEKPEREPRWQVEGVYGIRESSDPKSRFTPIVYVSTAKDEAAATELHRLLWNQDVAPYIIVHTITGLRVYSGFTYSPKARRLEDTGVLQTLIDFKNADTIVSLFHSREIDEGKLWQHPHLRVDPSHRVYHRLLSSLRELDKTLQNAGKGLSKDVSHALIGKYVYLRYLRDRGILSNERLTLWGLNADEIFGPKTKKVSLERLSDCLDDWLNGEIFPLSWRGESSPSIDQIQSVAAAFRGDELGVGSSQAHLGFEAYNFSFIPIETLSLVYEQFLHIEDPKLKNKGKKTKGRKEGAYYTPLPLVNFMLAGLERQRPLERGMKVLDPSSGSGSFLVQTYRLLIEKTFPITRTKPKPKELRELLEQSIFGCDVDGDACQVTQLSLLLTLLDYVEPPDLTGPMHSFKLPTLCETTNEKKITEGHTPNILKHNFFGIETKLGIAVIGKQGAIADWKTEGFDWIIGNPPWKTISPKKLGVNDAPVLDWMESHAQSEPVGLNQAAQAFAWEAPRFLKADGECALLIPAMGLFEEPSENFRKSFFSAFQVHEVANFANLAEVLFDGRARVPAAAISYRNRLPDEAVKPEEVITVFSPFVVNQEATYPRTEGERGKIWSLSVNSSEVRSIEQNEAASGSGLPWKLSMWGSPWDELLLRRLEKKWESIRQLEERKIVLIKEGPQLRLTPRRRNPDEPANEGSYEENLSTLSKEELADLKFEKMDALIGKPVLQTKAFARTRHVFSIAKTALEPNKAPYVCLIHGKSGLEICDPPHVFLSATGSLAIYSEQYFILPARQLGVISPSADKEFLKALSLFLSSDFAFYHQFFRSTELGIKRDRSTLESLRKMPIPLMNLSREELQEWSALHAKLIKCKPRKLEDTKKKPNAAQQDFFEGADDDLESLLERLNTMTGDILGLSKEERSLVHDLVQVRYALNDGKRGDAAMRSPSPAELKAYAKALKDELDEFAGDFAGRSHKVTVVANPTTAMIEVDFTTDHEAARKPLIHAATDTEAKALNQTRKRLLNDEGALQWSYFDRNLRIYRGRKTYLFKPLHRFHWTLSAALTDASQIIAETLTEP